MKISQVAHGRDNNYNLIRIVAALAVLFSHSFALATGLGSAEPLKAGYGLTLGDIAVDIFFVTSGFLVTGSLLSRNGVVAFIWARALRIYPALWVMLGMTVFVMGSALTTLPVEQYLTQYGTRQYLFLNATLFQKVDYYLPGMFLHTPWKYAVNGSLWTLTPEVRIYTLLLALWIVGGIVRAHQFFMFRAAAIAIAIISGVWYLQGGPLDAESYSRLIFMFFSGASFYLLKERIELRLSLAVCLLTLIAVSCLQPTILFVVLSLSLPYVVMVLAYLPGGPIRSFNRLGDYSYGIYIYAFPVQQMLASLVHRISSFELMCASAVITSTLAVLSWHIVEKRALSLKTVCADKTRHIMLTEVRDFF